MGCGCPVDTSAAGRSTDRADRRDQRHLRYIKKPHPIRYTNLLISFKPTAYLASVDEEASEMFDQLVKQLAKQEGVTEQLKSDNQMLWVQRMNNIRNRAKEIVNYELIYS